MNQNPLNFPKTFILVILGLFLFSACVKEELTVLDPKPGVTPEFGVPLVKANLSAKQIIRHFDPNSEVIEENNRMLSLVYRDSLARIFAGDYLALPNQSFEEKYTLTPVDLTELEETGEVHISGTEIISLDIGPDRLDSIRFSSGSLALRITADGTMPISGTISLLDAYSDQSLLDFQINQGEAPVFLDAEADLTNVLFRLLQTESHTNGLKISYALDIGHPGISPSEIQFEGFFNSVYITAAGGYIAPRDILLDRFEAHISMFDSDFNGELRLEDPRINVYFNNGFGLSVQPVADRVEGIDVRGASLVVNGSDIAPFPAIDAAPHPGETQLTSLAISNASMTPSVTDFMAFQPQFINGDFRLKINPQDRPSSFVAADNGLDIRFEVEVPIFGSLANFSLVDTTEVKLDEIADTAEDFGEIQEVQFRLFVQNGLPVDASVQLVFLDSDFQAVDSLFGQTQNIIPAAPTNLSGNLGLDDYGRVTGITSHTVDVKMSRERALALRNAPHLVVRVGGHTTTNGDHPIRIFPEDHIQVHLAAKAKFNFD